MATITSLPVASTIDATADTFPIVTNSLNTTQQISRNTFLNLLSQPVGLTDTQVLTNKTLTSPTINGATLSGTLAGTYTIGGTPTFPSTVTQNTASQTLTNKTLTSPTINSPTITNATINADTLTGYTTSNSGTIYGIPVTTGTMSASYLTASTITNTQIASAGLYTTKVYNPYKFSVYLSSNQTVSATTWTKVQLNTKAFDTGSNFDNTTNYQFTAPVNGFYNFSAYGIPSATSTNTVQVGINVGTFSGNPTYFVSSSPGNGLSFSFGLSVLVSLTAGQTVQMYTYSATTLIFSGASGTYFMGYLVSTT